MQPSDFPQYHQSIKDHSASREKLLAAVAHHKQHVWEKELAVTLEYRELQERWRTYFYSQHSSPVTLGQCSDTADPGSILQVYKAL